jgi:hypothetical protein
MSWGALAAPNHRGVLVPRVLGIALAAAAAVATAVVAAVAHLGAAGWGALIGCLLVCAAGVVDDLAGDGPRGIRGHLWALANGHVTTGIVKVLVTVGSAVVVITLQPPRHGPTGLWGIVLLAASANVGNGLDVRPGRALKAFLLPGAAFVLWGEVVDAPAILGLLAGAVVALPADLRERAMLGDGGANLLGFGAGLALYDVLGDGWVAVAALATVALNVVAETVTFSRVIEVTAPLRFLDGLGRRR